MNEAKVWALTNLADFVGLLDESLKSEDWGIDDKMFYIGQVAN